ncbi:MAG TPA: hypothetical protein DHU78_07200 [Opitutae bacterium]|nr:hypothetical protein [Opitutae bacterium]HCY58622.1 hypothetical protein [Opitutae bacterium]|tara:strand:- start:12929 stop:13510 length:582 start_codon:yes stop_codon:yes gene_type:complete
MIIQVISVESPYNPSISSLNDATFKELQLNRDDQPKIEVPDSGQESSIKVTKSPEPIELGGNLSSEDSLENQLKCPQAGNPLPSVDNLDDAGIDCTRKPDWEVVKPTQLPEEAGPGQFHNDKFWDERSLDEELQKKDLQQEIIDREVKEFNKAAERGEDFSRPFRNEVLDPYYQSGSDPSEPPSAGHSLDSFI